MPPEAGQEGQLRIRPTEAKAHWADQGCHLSEPHPRLSRAATCWLHLFHRLGQVLVGQALVGLPVVPLMGSVLAASWAPAAAVLLSRRVLPSTPFCLQLVAPLHLVVPCLPVVVAILAELLPALIYLLPVPEKRPGRLLSELF